MIRSLPRRPCEGCFRRGVPGLLVATPAVQLLSQLLLLSVVQVLGARGPPLTDLVAQHRLRSKLEGDRFEALPARPPGCVLWLASPVSIAARCAIFPCACASDARRWNLRCGAARAERLLRSEAGSPLSQERPEIAAQVAEPRSHVPPPPHPPPACAEMSFAREASANVESGEASDGELGAVGEASGAELAADLEAEAHCAEDGSQARLADRSVCRRRCPAVMPAILGGPAERVESSYTAAPGVLEATPSKLVEARDDPTVAHKLARS